MTWFYVSLVSVALIPTLILVGLILYRRKKYGVRSQRQRTVEEFQKALRDLEGPARVGYLEIRRVDPDTIFHRSPGRGL